MLKVITKPTVEPVTLAEAKLHCRVDVNDDDALITSLITTARTYCETFTGRAFCQQTLQLNLNRWPSKRAISLPRPPLRSVTSLTYYQTDGTPVVLTAGTDYLVDVDSEPGQIILPYGKSWPTNSLYPLNPIRIVYIAGYEPVTGPPIDYRVNVPEYIKAAVKLCVGNWYEHREAVLPAGHVGKELPMGVQHLLWQERVSWSEEMNR
jgi:uncharacterized phiE125 gp8 family phage protein